MARTKKIEEGKETTASAPTTDKLTLSNPAELTVKNSEPTVVKEGKFTIIHH